MAIELNGANLDSLDFGILQMASDVTAYSFAFTLVLKEDIDSKRLIGNWGGVAPEDEWSFSVGGQGSNIGWLGLVPGFSGRLTTVQPGVNGDTLRFLFKTSRGSAGSNGYEIWVNGVKVSTINWFGDWTTGFLSVANAVLSLCTDSGDVGGVWGIYSEMAFWEVEVPDQAAIDYSNQLSPLFYPDGLILYVSAATLPFTDEVGSHVVTAVGGTVIPGTPYTPPAGGGGGIPPGVKVNGPSIALGLGL